MGMQIIRAEDSHLELLLPLFNGYRKFYSQPINEQATRTYLENRISNDEAVIFLAIDTDSPGELTGFVLLYPTFDSVEMVPVWVLHDLFVNPEYRRRGIGKSLMDKAKDFCREKGAARIDLATATDNFQAQSLYESLDYVRDSDFYQYSLDL